MLFSFFFSFFVPLNFRLAPWHYSNSLQGQFYPSTSLPDTDKRCVILTSDYLIVILTTRISLSATLLQAKRIEAPVLTTIGEQILAEHDCSAEEDNDGGDEDDEDDVEWD